MEYKIKYLVDPKVQKDLYIKLGVKVSEVIGSVPQFVLDDSFPEAEKFREVIANRSLRAASNLYLDAILLDQAKGLGIPAEQVYSGLLPDTINSMVMTKRYQIWLDLYTRVEQEEARVKAAIDARLAELFGEMKAWAAEHPDLSICQFWSKGHQWWSPEMHKFAQERDREAAHAQRVLREKAYAEWANEMNRWAEEYGSDRLKMGIAAGYFMDNVYIEERAAQEYPGFFVDFNNEVGGVLAKNPSLIALEGSKALSEKYGVQVFIDLDDGQEFFSIHKYLGKYDLYQSVSEYISLRE